MLTDSERELVEAMRAAGDLAGRPSARRSNPGVAAPWELLVQSPEPEQPWESIGSYATRGAAIDEAVGLWPRRPAGTVVFVEDHRGETARSREDPDLRAWLGLVDTYGSVVEAPGFSGNEPGFPVGWREAWGAPPSADRDRTLALWMLSQSKGVDPVRITRVACDCARSVLRLVPDDRRPLAAVELAEAWCRGRATYDEVWEASVQAKGAASGYDADAQMTGNAAARKRLLAAKLASRSAGYAAATAKVAAAVKPRYPAEPAEIAGYAMKAAMDAETAASGKTPDFAPAVRRYISLGMVLSAKLRR